MKDFIIILIGIMSLGLIAVGFQPGQDQEYYILLILIIGVPTVFVLSLIAILMKGAKVGISKMPQPTQDKALKPFRFLDRHRMLILVGLGLFIVIMLAIISSTQ